MPNYLLPSSQVIMDFQAPIIMGIVNLTPDSFFEGSRTNLDQVVGSVGQMIKDGVDIVDIGAMSSRPGAKELSTTEEIQRLIPALKRIREVYPKVPISIDTYRSDVVNEAAQVGIDMVNDITAGQRDKSLFATIAGHKLPYVMMHMKGMPETMQADTKYDDLNLSILSFFTKRIHMARTEGIHDLIIDPGIGFGKSIDDNYRIIRHLKSYQLFDLPVLIGVSRKSFIYKTLGSDAAHALNGTTAMHMLSLLNGANVLRVHDVKEAVECKLLYKKYIQ